MADAVPYNPPLTPRRQAWRLGLCLVLSALAWWEFAPAQLDTSPTLFVVDLLLGLVAYVAVLWRRRYPLAVALGLSALTVGSAIASGPATLAFVSLATHRRIGRIALVAAVTLVSGQLFYYYEPELGDKAPPWLNFTIIAVATVAVAAIGMYVGSRRELVWTLRERARQAEAEQALRVDQARSAERERIAREMHDVLAHRISLVAMHSGALAFRTDLPPEQVRETAELIQAKSHEALADLRQVLGMLREDEVPHQPQPTIEDIADLVAEARASGLAVDFRDDLRATPPEQVGRTLYRVVQEALTNVRKHGGGDHVRVRIGGRPDRGVAVVVSNPKPFGSRDRPPPASGLGLVGMRERIELTGGRLRVIDTGTTFTLRGWLPWPT